jgi:hypothetical protein
VNLPTAPRIGDAAIQAARSRSGGSMPASGYCLQFVRECYGVPAVYGSAVDAARACDAPHPGDRNPPPGTPVWFWSSSVYDHVAFYVGPHEVISTFNADIRTFDGIGGIEANFGAGTAYAGWGEHLNEHIVWAPGTGPAPEEEDDDMRPMLIRQDNGTVALVGPKGVRAITPAELETWWNLGYRYSPGMEAMQAGPFAAVVSSLGGWVE